jgi:hypothetical protein
MTAPDPLTRLRESVTSFVADNTSAACLDDDCNDCKPTGYRFCFCSCHADYRGEPEDR